MDKFNPRIQKMIEEDDIEGIADLIENGEVKETKEILTIQGTDGWTVAHELASRSDLNSWSTYDKDILKIRENNFGETVAHKLAANHPTWTIEDPEILNLEDENGVTVEDILREEGKIR